MKHKQSTTDINRKMYIVTAIGVLIAALTFLFGSGVLPQFNSQTPNTFSDADSSITDGNSIVDKTYEDIKPDLNYYISSLGTIQDAYGTFINVESAQLINDGFYFEYPGTNMFINMEKLVLTGTFSYPKDLSEDEKEMWGYGGDLLNSKYQSCYIDNTGFWSNYEIAQFAVDLPEDIVPGKYICIIYHYINDQQYSATIKFEIY